MVNTRGQDGPSRRALRFRERLTGKSLTTDALLKKLKALQTELEELQTEKTELSTLNTVRKDLIHSSLLLHKDRGVKAYVAAALADLLRIHAPDAPFTPAELHDIFEFMLRQLTAGLSGADAPYYAQYFRVLEQLASSKSVVLVCDLPHADTLMTSYFKEFFNIARRDIPRKVEMLMADILSVLVDETNNLPLPILEKYLLPQFQSQDLGMDQAGFRLAVHICNSSADKLQRHVCQYFTEVIVEHTQEDDVDYEEISAAHNLIKNLHAHCPGLLHNIIPQLEEELRAQQHELRTLATRTLGDMFAEKGGRELLKKYPSTWEFWLGRRNDKDTPVRLTWVEATQALLVKHCEPRKPIEDGLSEKLMDPDERVRVAVCKVYSQLDYETALHHVSDQQLQLIANRSVDKKPAVRLQSLTCIGKLYSLAYPEIENGDPAALKQFSWIPQRILQTLGGFPEARTAAEQILAEYILPLPSVKSSAGEISENAWTERLLLIMRHLDDKTTKHLLAATGLKQQRPTVYERYVQACFDNNGGVIDKDEEGVRQRLALSIRRLAASYPDSTKAAEDFKVFADENEKTLYKLLDKCMSVEVDLRTLVKSGADFRKRLEQSNSSLLPTFSTFLRRGSLHFINQSSIPTLIKRIQSGSDAAARKILVYVSKHCPLLFSPHAAELAKALVDDRDAVLVELCLQALAALAKENGSLVSSDRRTMDRVARYAVSNNRRHAKFAARLLAHATEGHSACEDVISTIADALPEAEPQHVVGHVAALVQFARAAPDAFETRSEDLMAFLLQRVLGGSAPIIEDEETEWAEDDDVWPELQAKILALKVCRQRCLAYAESDDAMAIATPVLKLLLTLLLYSGSLTEAARDDPRVKSRMRLQAAISLLHLCTIKVFESTIIKAPNFLTVALVTQDSCFPVRQRFVTKLVSLLMPRRLGPRFNVMVFLTAHDPEPEITAMARTYVTVAWRAQPPQIRLEEFELILIRILHLLAHHPDLTRLDDDSDDEVSAGEGEDDAAREARQVERRAKHRAEIQVERYKQLIKYIQFYVDTIATADNASLLYYVAGRAKTVRDAEGDPYSEHLYVASELAQEIIKAKANSKGWSLDTYPGKVKIPGDILRPLATPQEQKRIAQTVWLPSALATYFAEQGKGAGKDKPKAKLMTERKAPTKRKASAAQRNGNAKRRRRRKARDSDDDDDESSDEDDDEEDEDEDEMDVDEDRNAAKGEESDSSESPNRRVSLGRGARTRAREAIKAQTKSERRSGRRREAQSSDEE